jgi:hypothetical protein
VSLPTEILLAGGAEPGGQTNGEIYAVKLT